MRDYSVSSTSTNRNLNYVILMTLLNGGWTEFSAITKVPVYNKDTLRVITLEISFYTKLSEHVLVTWRELTNIQNLIRDTTLAFTVNWAVNGIGTGKSSQLNEQSSDCGLCRFDITPSVSSVCCY